LLRAASIQQRRNLRRGLFLGGNVPQAAFAGATVEGVAVKGQTAVARFSNGELVEFQQDPENKWWVLNPAISLD
jgi:hypothetical protein